MMMNVKRNYLIQLKTVLEHPESIFEGPVTGAIRYMVSMNYKVAKEEFDTVLQAFPFDEKYLEFQQKRREYLTSVGVQTDADFLRKDEDTRNAISERLNAIAEEYKDAIDVENELDKERDAFLEQTVDVNLYTIKPNELLLKTTETSQGWDVWNVLFNDGNGIVRE